VPAAPTPASAIADAAADHDGPPAEGRAEPDSFAYDAFFSYAGDPDHHLVREVEAFIEGLHQNPLIPPGLRRELEACVDGSDFKKPRAARRNEAQARDAGDPVFQLIVEHLRRSRHLAVFVGPASRDHRWLNQELEWWLRHRGTERLLLVLTHGKTCEPSEWMPRAARQAGMGGELWFDFRASRQAAPGSASTRLYEEERLRLAAALMGDGIAASDLVKGYKALSAQARKAERVKNLAFAGVAVLLAAGLGWAIRDGLDQAEANRAGIWTTLAGAGATLDPDRRLDALSYGLAALKTRPTAAAYHAVAESLQILAEPAGEAQIDPGRRRLRRATAPAGRRRPRRSRQHAAARPGRHHRRPAGAVGPAGHHP